MGKEKLIKKLFEVRLAVVQTWVHQIEASSKEEALKLYLENPGDYESYSVSGGDPNQGPIVSEVSKEN